MSDISEEFALESLRSSMPNAPDYAIGSLEGLYRIGVARGMTRAAACERALLTWLDIQRGGIGDPSKGEAWALAPLADEGQHGGSRQE